MKWDYSDGRDEDEILRFAQDDIVCSEPALEAKPKG